jgi:hypothetical protein
VDEEGDTLVEPQEELPLLRGDSIKKTDLPISAGEKQIILFCNCCSSCLFSVMVNVLAIGPVVCGFKPS